MKKLQIILTLLIVLPVTVLAQGYDVASIQKINNVVGGLSGDPLDNDDRFGNAVEVIGDVDHDGIDDIAVSSHLDDDGKANQGAIYILMLNADGSVKEQQKISALEGNAPSFEAGHYYFGSALAALGDLNGDGNVDIAVGGYGCNDDGDSGFEGAVYILFLSDSGTVLEYQKISNNEGGGPGTLVNYDYFGRGLSSIGDLNGDGLPDIAIKAPGDDDGGANVGAVYIAFLDYNGTAKNIQKISATTGGFGGTLDAGDGFGTTTSLGDLDGDGVIDLAIGAPNDDDGGTDRGAVWVCFMNTDGTVKSEQKISDTAGGFTGTLDDSDGFGGGEGIEDLDGDGVRDLLVAATGDDDGGTDEGALWILYMNTDGTVKSHDKISTTDPVLSSEVVSGDKFCGPVSTFGDRNNDGKIDLLIGAWDATDDSTTNSGEVYIVHLDGLASYPNKQYHSTTTYLTAIEKHSALAGEPMASELGASDAYGYSVCGISDLDGDGIDDMVVGATSDDDGGSNKGAVYVQFLNADGSIKDYQKISDTQGNFTGTLTAAGGFGISVCSLGDLDSDGNTDIAVGAYADDDGGTNRGGLWILFLTDSGTVKSEQKISDTQGSFTGTLDDSDYFGRSVVSPGDIDGDGIQDLIVGAPYDDDGGSARGALWVLFLDTNGTVQSHQKISDTEGDFTGVLAANDFFGESLTTIGDMDGDGINDIAAGVSGDDDGGAHRGGFYILTLTDSGTVNYEYKISNTTGNFDGLLSNSDYFGVSIAGGYDLNSDGNNDIVVGAKLSDEGGSNVGGAWMLMMNADGTVKHHKTIGATSSVLLNQLDDADGFGISVAIIDYNTQNNTAKIAIGANGDDDGYSNSGAVYVTTIDLTATYDAGSSGGATHRSVSDLNYNWSYSESYDENYNLLGASKQYVDELGRSTQALTLNVDKNRVLAAQTIYDTYGRPAINTMPAPIGQNMNIMLDFATDVNGNYYNYSNFDVSGKNGTLNNPDSIASDINNSLGDYYSDNGEDHYIATSAFPYSRVEYTNDPTGRMKRAAAPGENFKMGSGNESRVFNMFTGGELDRAYGVDSSFYCRTDSTDRLESQALSNTEIVATKTISVDPEGNIAIRFTSDGLTIATCVSGITPPDSVPEQSASHTMLYAGTQSVDIHLPEAKSTTLVLPLPESPEVDTSDISYTIYDIDNDDLLSSPTDYTINQSTRYVTFSGTNKHRFLRIAYSYSDSLLSYFADSSITPPDATIEYKLDYSHFTANYYDLAGRLRMNVSPKGFDYSVNGKHTEFSKYDYDPYGQLIGKETPDEGRVHYLYSDEGMVRFSQNAQQDADGKFSYIRYDDYNRPIESGEYTENGATEYEFDDYYPSFITGIDVNTILDDVDFEFTSQTAEETYTAYDELDSADQIPAGYSYKSQYTQHNLKARVSKTWNDYNQTWYSYDYTGRPEFVVQEIIDTDFNTTKDETVKTIDYTYTPLTSVLTKEEYQKNHSSEKLTHDFTYNDNLQLLTVTAKDTGDNTVGEAAFEYYINGQLKRKEIGGTLQGMDYVYTLQGQLKSINHPSLYDEYDPGQDNKTGTAKAAFEADVFGMTLDYYEDDYVRTGSNITSSVSSAAGGYNNGLIKAARWKIKDENEIGATSPITLYTAGANDKEVMYNYTYDDFYRIETATFGVFDNDTTAAYAFDAMDHFKLFGTSDSGGVAYDIIGNITSLNRNGYDAMPGPLLLMDSLSYTYTTGTSQLATITDNSASTYATDFETSGTDNFTYNNLGQMTASEADSVDAVTYYPTGQVKKVTFSNNNTAEYFYNERNIKIKSIFTDSVASPNVVKYNWYLTDASGALKSVHERTDAGSVSLTNQAVYGGGRLGMLDIATGKVNYEITDHLGNVRLSIRDSSTVGNPSVEVLSWADYYPFGEVMPGRNSDPTGMFGYQGQERVSNSTNSVSGSRWYNFQLRMYNPSLGRFNTIDPYSQFNSPYLAMANNPISYVDPDGGQAVLTQSKKDEIYRRATLNRHKMTRRNWLILMLHASGNGNYIGITLEGLTATWDAGWKTIGIHWDPRDGYVGPSVFVNTYLSILGGGFKDYEGNNGINDGFLPGDGFYEDPNLIGHDTFEDSWKAAGGDAPWQGHFIEQEWNFKENAKATRKQWREYREQKKAEKNTMPEAPSAEQLLASLQNGLSGKSSEGGLGGTGGGFQFEVKPRVGNTDAKDGGELLANNDGDECDMCNAHRVNGPFKTGSMAGDNLKNQMYNLGVWANDLDRSWQQGGEWFFGKVFQPQFGLILGGVILETLYGATKNRLLMPILVDPTLIDPNLSDPKFDP